MCFDQIKIFQKKYHFGPCDGHCGSSLDPSQFSVSVDERRRGVVVVAGLPVHAGAGRWRHLLAGEQAPGGRPEVFSQQVVEEKVGRRVDPDQQVAGVDDHLDLQDWDLECEE